MKNSDYVNSWRIRKGNSKRKSIYSSLRDLGVEYKQAMIMRYWSIDRINQWLISHDFEVVDING